MSYDSGLTSVTGNVNAQATFPVLGSSQTFIVINGAGDGTTKSYRTVTTGKTFYLYSLQVIPGYIAVAYLNNGTTEVIRNQQGATVTWAVVSPVPLAVYTSTQSVMFNCSNSATFTAIGVEI